MNPSRTRRVRIHPLALLAVAGAALLAPAAGAAAKSDKAEKKDPKITVMSRNVYLGADLGPAINAADTCAAIDAGGEILNQVDRTDFEARSKLLAKEIAKAKPDLVGLQEVALWRFSETPDFTGSEATQVRYDFLALLQAALKERGAKYKVAVEQNEFDQELPADRDGSDATNEFICGADEDGRLTMRDVILRRKDSKVDVSDPESGQFDNRYEVLLGGAIPIGVDRGWVSVEAKVEKTKRTRGAKFKFVNTHLEAFGDPSIREAQAKELYEKGGPLRTKKQLVFLGDINSGSAKDEIEGDDRLAYEALADDFGLVNLGARQTCCYPSADLSSDEIGEYRFDHTVDHVMVKPRIKQLKSYVTGGDPTVTTPGGLVSSDHGGVVSKLKLKKK
jgi:endonuclease/exonuclease/phosphatase family metal-dependent hydrolase